MTILVNKKFKADPVPYVGSVSAIFYRCLCQEINNGLASIMGPTCSRKVILRCPTSSISSIISIRTLEVGLFGPSTKLKAQHPSRLKSSLSLTKNRRLKKTITERLPLHTSLNLL